MEYYEIATWRKKNGFTQAELAKRMGVASNTVSRWETGKYRLPINLKAKLNALLTEQPKDDAPETIVPANRESWPQFDLYRRGHKAGYWQAGEEHPRRLVPELCPKEGPVPSSILLDQRYLAALKASRGDG